MGSQQPYPDVVEPVNPTASESVATPPAMRRDAATHRKAKKAKSPPNPLTPKNSELRILVTEEEAAKMLGVSPAYLQRDRIGRRLIPYIKIIGMVRYVPEELYATIQKWRAERDAALATERESA